MVNWLIDSLGLLVLLVTNTICIETSPDDVRRRGGGDNKLEHAKGSLLCTKVC